MLNTTQRCSQCRQAYLKSSFVKGDGRCIKCRANAGITRLRDSDGPFSPSKPDPWTKRIMKQVQNDS